MVTWKHIPWRLVVAIIAIFVLALFAAGQAVTFAWLSGFPERASQLPSLQLQFWSYAIASVILLLIDIVLTIYVLKKIRNHH